MTFLVTVVCAALFGAGALVTTDRRPVSLTMGIGGLAVVAFGALILVPGSAVTIGEVTFDPTAYVGQWLLLGALAGILLSVVAMATGDTRNPSGPILLCLALGGLAVAAGDPQSSLLLGSVVGIAALPLSRGLAGVGELRAIAASAAIAIVGVAWMGPHTGADSGGVQGAEAPGASLIFLATATALAVRIAAVPLHRRAVQIAESVGSLGLPVVLALGPAVFAAVLVGWVGPTFAMGADTPSGSALLATSDPLRLERALVVVVAAATVSLAAVAAWIQDDLRHLLAYSIVANAGFLLLGLADRTGASGEATRVWAVSLVQVTFTLGASFAALERAFGSSSVDSLSGWARRMPVLAVAIAGAAVTTLGLPGLGVWEVRQRLAASAVGGPFAALILVAGAAVVLPLVRLVVVGLGPPSARVRGGVSERPMRGERVELAWSPRPMPPRDPVERFAHARARSRSELSRGLAQAEALWVANRTIVASVGALLLAVLAMLAAVDAFGLRAAAAA
jgi:hypothetical protein